MIKLMVKHQMDTIYHPNVWKCILSLHLWSRSCTSSLNLGPIWDAIAVKASPGLSDPQQGRDFDSGDAGRRRKWSGMTWNGSFMEKQRSQRRVERRTRWTARVSREECHNGKVWLPIISPAIRNACASVNVLLNLQCPEANMGDWL